MEISSFPEYMAFAMRARIGVARHLIDEAMDLAVNKQCRASLCLLETAETILKSVAGVEPDMYEFYLARALLYNCLKKKELAKEAFLKAYALEPNDPLVHDIGTKLPR